MELIKELPDANCIRENYALSEAQLLQRQKLVDSIKKILSGTDSRKIMIIGPCSADREDSVLDYVERLARLAEEYSNKFIFIPRIYTSKPRTTGIGYKGILHNPTGTEDEDILLGIISSRKLHLKVINETGLFAADEMLYPEEIYYLSDLLCYMAVGARSVEDQGHRMVASDDLLPVGLKNPTGGSLITLVNSIKAAQCSHRFIYRGWEVKTNGNQYAHAILRGYTNNSGNSFPNYHYENLCELYDLLLKAHINNPSVIVDCNHSNSNKKYNQQSRIAKEVFSYFKNDCVVDNFVKGLMIESYLVDGNQLPGAGVYGKSITDACLGWEKTEKLIYELACL